MRNLGFTVLKEPKQFSLKISSAWKTKQKQWDYISSNLDSLGSGPRPVHDTDEQALEEESPACSGAFICWGVHRVPHPTIHTVTAHSSCGDYFLPLFQGFLLYIYIYVAIAHLLEWPNSGALTTPNAGENVSSRSSHSLLVRSDMGWALWKTVW